MKKQEEVPSVMELLYLIAKKCVRTVKKKFGKKNILKFKFDIPENGNVCSVKIPKQYIAFISEDGTLNIRKRQNHMKRYGNIGRIACPC